MQKLEKGGGWEHFRSGKAAIAFLCITGTQCVKESSRNKLFTWKGCQFCMNQVLFFITVL